MKRFPRFCAIFLIVAILAILNFGNINIYAAISVSDNMYIAAGTTKEYNNGVDFQNYSKVITLQNYGTLNVSTRFTLYNTSCINDGIFNFTGSSSSSTFSFDSSSFTNNGTATITGVYNFMVQPGTSFINKGTLFLEDIVSINADGFVNNGMVVVADDFNPYLKNLLEQKNMDGSSLLTKTEFENKTVNYRINYNIDDNVENDNPFIYTYSAADPQEIRLNRPSKNGYLFLGWTENDTDIPEPDFTFSSTIQRDITLTAHWEPEIYSITYNLDGGTFDPTSDKPKDTYTTEDENYLLPRLIKEGYTFLGWTDSDDSTPTTSKYILAHSTGNKTFTANFIANTDTRYTVTCYYQNLDGAYANPSEAYADRDTYYEKESHLFSGETGTSITVSPEDYCRDGFSYDNETLLNKLSGEITADPVNPLNLYLHYNRNKYTVTYKTQDGSEILATEERFYGETVGEYKGEEPQKLSDDDLYTYVFVGWARYENLDFAITDPSILPVNGDITFYAAFEQKRREDIVVVHWEDYTGFLAPEQTEIKLRAGETYTVNLQLENENYYIGTKEWSFPSFALESILWNDPATGDHPMEYTIDCEGFKMPIVLTIPNIQHDIHIILNASYHEEHDYSPAYDTIITDGGCITDSTIRHFCYKCGKTYDETIPAAEHSLEESFQTDETSHWKVCRICGQTVELAAHTPDEGVITHEPTHSSTGTKTYSCTVCGYVTKRESLPMAAHTFPDEWQYTPEVHYKTCECGERIEEAHISDEGVVAAGIKTYSCTICGYVLRTESIPPAEVPEISPTLSPAPTATPEISPTPSPTPTAAPKISPTPSPTPTAAPKISPTPSPTPTATPELSPTPSPTPTAAPEISPTLSPAPTATPEISPTPSPTPTAAPKISPTPSPTPTAAPKISPTPSPTPTATPELSPTPSPTPTAAPEISSTPSPTPTAALEISSTPSPTPTATAEKEPSLVPSPSSLPADTVPEQNGRTGTIIPVIIIGTIVIILSIILLLLRRKKNKS